MLKLQNKLDSRSAGGPDGIPPIFLKKYCHLHGGATYLSFFHFPIQAPSYHRIGLLRILLICLKNVTRLLPLIIVQSFSPPLLVK